MKISLELKVGVMVVLSVAILMLITLKTGKVKLRKEGYTVYVLFQQIEGVGRNAPVMLNGLEVGYVDDISMVNKDNETWMSVGLWIDEGVQIQRGTSALVKNMGFMGEKYIGLESGSKEGYIAAGETFVGREPASMDHLILQGSDIVQDVKSITGNVEERLQVNKDHIDSIFRQMDMTLTHVESIAESVDERLSVNKDHIDEIMRHLNQASTNLDEFTLDLKDNPWKLLYRPKESKGTKKSE
jgi:phospholipid/cholesterol/gamma-HCH transport system substrate-binding protein